MKSFKLLSLVFLVSMTGQHACGMFGRFARVASNFAASNAFASRIKPFALRKNPKTAAGTATLAGFLACQSADKSYAFPAEAIADEFQRMKVITNKLCKSSLDKPVDQRPGDCILAAYSQAMAEFFLKNRISPHQQPFHLAFGSNHIAQTNPELAKAFERLKHEKIELDTKNEKFAEIEEKLMLAEKFLKGEIDDQTYMKS